MEKLLKKVPKFLFFTGKGGVGKTTISCAISLALAKEGKKVLLISTDPASNLDEVLQAKISNSPTKISKELELYAMNINPLIAAQEYIQKMTSPYIGVLPDEAIEQIKEQLSGACTVEIAGFNEFSKYVGEKKFIDEFDHIILDTAPTGHTLRLLSLPSAWKEFIANNKSGSSCLGPVSGLSEYKELYDSVVENLKDEKKTLLVLVSRAEELSLIESSRASDELKSLGLNNQHLVINGVFESDSSDEIAKAFSKKSSAALTQIPKNLKELQSTKIGFYPKGVVGISSLNNLLLSKDLDDKEIYLERLKKEKNKIEPQIESWKSVLDELSGKNGLIMTMGKGGVGKTSIAAMIANELAKRGEKVILSTTDPASHIEYLLKSSENLSVEKIDAKVETKKHQEEVISKNRDLLSKEDMRLLEEELNSPCIEEIAIFKAFAKIVDRAKDSYVVLDTAPTGHTLLLLDSSEAYHKEVLKESSDMSKELKELLPRLKDSEFTKIFIVALAEATPTHEAKALQDDLQRASINPYAWVVNRSFAFSATKDSILVQKGLNELKYIKEIKDNYSPKIIISPWVKSSYNEKDYLESIVNKG